VSSINRVLRNLTTETHRSSGVTSHHFFTPSHVYDKFGSLFAAGVSQAWTHRTGHPWYSPGPGTCAGAAGVFQGADMTSKIAGGDVACHTSHVNQMSSSLGPLQCGAVDRKCESFPAVNTIVTVNKSKIRSIEI